MLKNYLRIAFRQLRKHTGYTVLNVAGLGLGLACCFAILLFVHDELSYDRFHENADRIYRLIRETTEAGTVTSTQANVGAAIGPTMQQTMPGIDAVARVVIPFPGRVLARTKKTLAYDEGFFWADSSFFEVFSFRFLHGDPATALAEPYTIVLTESAAKKYYGDTDPVGQTITIDGWTKDDYRVTAVMADVPSNAHLQFSMLASMKGAEQVYSNLFAGEGAWVNSLAYTYLLLDRPETAGRLAEQIPAFTEQHLGEFARARGITLSFLLQPLTSIHLDPTVKTVVGTTGDRRYVVLFSTVALFILLLAAINFVNLSTARSAERAREVGVRKAVGARRGQLIGQFLSESVLMALLAFVLALGLLKLSLPALNALTGKMLAFGLHDTVRWLGLALGVGVLAGLYPAFVLAGLRPSRVLKGQFRTGRSGARLRQGLVVFQFAVSIALLVGSGVIYNQLHFMRSAALGFDEEEVVVLPIQDRAMREQPETIKAALRQHPNVVQVAATSGVPGRLMLTDTWPVVRAEASGQPINLLAAMADADFVATMGLDVVAGRALSAERATDAEAGFLINETAVRVLGWPTPEQALGQRITWQQGEGKTGEIVGVVRDFHMRSLHQQVEPMLLHVFPSRYSAFAVRIRAEEVPATLDFLKDQWQQFDPEHPFEFFFLDAELDALYRTEETLGETLGLFALLAVLVACLGLFGLAAFATRQRTKEIGVRKVLGATAAGLVVLLSKDFLRLVALAFVVAVPIAWWGMSQWLEGFAYRVSLGPAVFVLAGVLALAVALASVSFHAWRTATADPVKSLRYE